MLRWPLTGVNIPAGCPDRQCDSQFVHGPLLQIKRAKTDEFTTISWDNPDRAEANNLLTIYQLSTGKSKEDVLKDVVGLNWGGFKPLLADALIAHLEPIQNR